ncbi:amidohydrolase family protein [uncultured Sulfitobacter sp.]|uniref:amidohydrolase family protein n=1 Tax=uncultured Sulfitobacter sp. TaxID=191468 RepID=UPI00261F2B77|nr:amidohydrolase family protein [uncultured Sulfitobacter sp.]
MPKTLLRDPAAFGGHKQGDLLIGAPVIRSGKLTGLDTVASSQPAPIVIPPLTEPHCHLDKCYTIGRLGPVAGDLATAIAAQYNDKVNWTAQDIRARASRGLSEAQEAGVTTLRSHVDWGDGILPPLSWHILREIAQETPQVTLQLSPLTGVDRMADRAFTAQLAQAAAQAKGALGAFVQNHTHMHDGIRMMFEAAQKHALPLDFHVDEGLADLNGLEMVADLALETGFDGPILCGHAVSLMNRDEGAFARIADKLARAGITVCALPTTNLYLQDRRTGTPDRRGITRLRELRAAGVSVLVGSDNVADAFCPMGQFDPMAALHLAALAAHLDPPMAHWLDMITTDARRALGFDPQYIEDTPLDHLLISVATDCEALVAGRNPLRPMQSLLT